MLPAYIHAVGGTEKIKHLLDWIESQHMQAEDIRKKHEEVDGYAIGDDTADRTEGD